MPFQVQNGKSRKRVCTLKAPVKRIQNSGQSLLAGQVKFCDPQKLLDTTHFGLTQTGNLPQPTCLIYSG